MVVEKPMKLRITVENAPKKVEKAQDETAEDDEEVLFFDNLTHESLGVPVVPDKLRDAVEITRPFNKRKRYQNPDYYIRKPVEEDNSHKKIEEITAEERNLTTQEKLKRRQKRAKTFGQVWGEIIAPESDLIQKFQDKTTEEKKSKARATAIHVSGVNKFSTEKVFEYFKPHPPESLEWIDDDSCNIIYANEKECSNCFLQYLSTHMPEYHRIKADEVKEEAKDEDESTQEQEEGEVDDSEITKNVLKVGKDSIYVAERKEDLDEIRSNLTNIWRYGPLKVIDNEVIILKCRYAVEGDRKEQNSMLKSKYYQQHGNPYFDNMTGIFTNSFKERFLKSKGIKQESLEDLLSKDSSRASVFSRLGNKSANENPSPVKKRLGYKTTHPKPKDDDDSEQENDMSDTEIDDLLQRALPEPDVRERSKRSLSKSSVSSEGSESSTEILMSLKSAKRMKLYSDDLMVKERKKVQKVYEKIQRHKPQMLRVQLHNEHAAANLRRSRDQRDILEAKRKGMKVTSDGFIDTRDLYKDDLEENDDEKTLETVSDEDAADQLGEPPSPVDQSDQKDANDEAHPKSPAIQVNDSVSTKENIQEPKADREKEVKRKASPRRSDPERKSGKSKHREEHSSNSRNAAEKRTRSDMKAPTKSSRDPKRDEPKDSRREEEIRRERPMLKVSKKPVEGTSRTWKEPRRRSRSRERELRRAENPRTNGRTRDEPRSSRTNEVARRPVREEPPKKSREEPKVPRVEPSKAKRPKMGEIKKKAKLKQRKRSESGSDSDSSSSSSDSDSSSSSDSDSSSSSSSGSSSSGSSSDSD